MFKRLWRQIAPNPLELKLRRAVKEKKKSFLIFWNRGLGDIPLGLYALTHRIWDYIPDAAITFVTRTDLFDGFKMLKGVNAVVSKSLKRGQPFDINQILQELKIERSSFDLIIEHPDPTYWLKWQIGTLTPKLQWDKAWDDLCEKFNLVDENYIAAHVQTETSYGYEKNWPVEKWIELFSNIKEKRKERIILFGTQPNPPFELEGIIDLRGKTTLFEMISIIKNRTSHLIAPDSGVLSITYYIDTVFPIKVVSLWADPRQGVLKQNVASPNSAFIHLPLIGKEERVANISVVDVMEALFLKDVHAER